MDIVQRLRDAEPCRESICKMQDARSGCCCATAADEIERLRTELSLTQAVKMKQTAEIARMRVAVSPFLTYLADIKFNLRKQPRPSDAAIREQGERDAIVTWAAFYNLRDAFTNEQDVNK